MEGIPHYELMAICVDCGGYIPPITATLLARPDRCAGCQDDLEHRKLYRLPAGNTGD